MRRLSLRALVAGAVVMVLGFALVRTYYAKASLESNPTIALHQNHGELKIKHLPQSPPHEQPKVNCTELLSKVQFVSSTGNNKLRLVAAAPGSGSDWTKLSIQTLTGLSVSRVLPDTKNVPNDVIYIATHHPLRLGADFSNFKPDKVVIIIRNPFDAGYSEYIRGVVEKRKGRESKYGNLEEIMKEIDFLNPADATGEQTASAAMLKHMDKYTLQWKEFHEHWLTKYQGDIKVMLYKDMLADVKLFAEIAEYFGYGPDSSNELKTRYNCFLDNVEMTKTMKRPKSSVVDGSKDKVRKSVYNQTKEVELYVQRLYNDKYKLSATIS